MRSKGCIALDEDSFLEMPVLGVPVDSYWPASLWYFVICHNRNVIAKENNS